MRSRKDLHGSENAPQLYHIRHSRKGLSNTRAGEVGGLIIDDLLNKNNGQAELSHRTLQNVIHRARRLKLERWDSQMATSAVQSWNTLRLKREMKLLCASSSLLHIGQSSRQ